MIEYIEPGENFEPTTIRLTEAEAIARAKEVAKHYGHVYESDERALEDFIVVNWATVVDVAP